MDGSDGGHTRRRLGSRRWGCLFQSRPRTLSTTGQQHEGTVAGLSVRTGWVGTGEVVRQSFGDELVGGGRPVRTRAQLDSLLVGVVEIFEEIQAHHVASFTETPHEASVTEVLEPFFRSRHGRFGQDGCVQKNGDRADVVDFAGKFFEEES